MREANDDRAMDLVDALRLIYIVDEVGAKDGDRLDRVLGHGVTAVWLRDASASGADLFRTARALKSRLDAHGAALIVGDRADVALAVDAHGVQLGFRSPPARVVRPFFPGWLGVSCHGSADLQRAVAAGADFAVLSPVFGVPEKGTPLGVEHFRQLRDAVPALPVVALGGIDVDTAASVRSGGASGLAVIRALRDAPDPGAAARGLAPR